MPKVFNSVQAPRVIGILITAFFCIVLYLRNPQDLDAASHHVPGDFKVYLRAAERARSKVDPYVSSEGSPYKYSLGAVTPFLLLPHAEVAAWRVFKFVCLAMWFAALVMGTTFATWGELGTLCIGIALSWKGLIETLDYGQIEFFLLFAAVLAARKRKMPFISGFILGLLPPFKLPWGAILLPFLVISARTSKSTFVKTLAGFSFGLVSLGGIIPILLFGFENSLNWSRSWTKLLSTQPKEIYLNDMNQGLFSSSYRWHQLQPTLGLLLSAVMVLSSIFVVIRLSRQLTRPEADALPFTAPFLVALQLINPLSWRWGSMLLVGTPLAAKRNLQNKKINTAQLALIATAIALFLVQQNPVAHLLGFGHWTDLNHYGTITIFWMILLLLCV